MNIKKICLYLAIVAICLMGASCIKVPENKHYGQNKLSYTFVNGETKEFWVARRESVPVDALVEATSVIEGKYNLGWATPKGVLVNFDSFVIDRDIVLKEQFIDMQKPKTKEELKALVYDSMLNSDLGKDLNFIDTSAITDMSGLFNARKRPVGVSASAEDGNKNFKNLDIDISKWDVSKVKNFSLMFAFTDFAGDLSKWNVSAAENMKGMFYASPYFNADISKWDVSKVKNMNYMFSGAQSFMQDLSSWGAKLADGVSHDNFAEKTSSKIWPNDKLPNSDWSNGR